MNNKQGNAGRPIADHKSSYHVLSCGAGVNSTALMIILVESKMPFDEAIFADTTAEVPATYYHLENVIRPYLEHLGKSPLIWCTLHLEVASRRLAPVHSRNLHANDDSLVD